MSHFGVPGRHPAARNPIVHGACGLVVAMVLGIASAPAQAAYPGDNGRLACEGLRSPIAELSNAARTEVFTVNPDGSGEQVLTNNSWRDGDPGYSPDGSLITYENLEFGYQEMFRMGSDGSNPVRLTTSGPNEDRGSSWSPDGSRIVFHSTRDPLPADAPMGSSRFELYVMDADGGNETRLTNNLAQDSLPAWSPDGSRIAFLSNRDGDFEIYTMDPDGSDVLRLTSTVGEDAHPSWSPDGSQITFHSRREGNLDVYRMNADGSNPVRLTNTPDVFEYFPVWSPDGRRIAFNGNLHTADPANTDVYHIDAVTGGDLQRVTFAPGFDGRCDWAAGRRMSVAMAGSGSGVVTSVPPGIGCGADCTEVYNTNSTVTLIADAAPGSVFEGFSGAGCSGPSVRCTVAMSEARSVTATFRAPAATAPPPPPPPPPPVAVVRRRPGVSAQVSPRRELQRPYRFRITGRITHPSSLRASEACKGRVAVRFKAGTRTISLRRPWLTRTCRFSRTVVFRDPSRFGRRTRLRVQVRFEGNKVLQPRQARSVEVRVR